MTIVGRSVALVAGWVARLLLAIYPPRFRREVGREVVRDLELGVRENMRTRGIGTAVRWSARNLRALAANVYPAWRDGTAQLVFEPPSPWDGSRSRFVADFRADLVYGVRQVMRNPGFSAVAILILALGIGANTAILSVVDALILRPLPFAQEDRLISPEQFPLALDGQPASAADVYAFRDQLPSFESLAAWTVAKGANLSGLAEPARIEASEVTPEFFATLGVDMAIGRAFAGPEDTRVVVLSHRAWRTRLGGDPDVVGRSISLNDRPVTIIGVAPSGFSLPEAADLWLPMDFGGDRVIGGSRVSTTVGRLAPGVTIEQARAELALFAQRNLAGTWMEEPAARARTLRNILVGGTRTSLLVLLGATGLILLVACGNLANLFLTRAIARRQELSVRSSLGAGVGRLVRQLTTEALVLGFIGGAFGIGLSYLALRGIVAFAPAGFPRFTDPRVDLRVLAFAIGLSALTGLAFGAWPALEGARFDLAEALKAGTNRHGGPLGTRRHGPLVVGQVALTFVLLVSGGLLLQSLMRLRAVDPGFRADGAITVSVSPTERDPVTRATLLRSILTGLRALPGVQSAGAVNFLPLGTRLGFGVLLEIDGRAQDAQPHDFPTLLFATPGYFESLGIPVSSGRAFNDGDREGSPRVAILNRAFARKYWPDRSPIGDRVRTPGDEEWSTVIGVVDNVRTWTLDQEDPAQVYFAAAQADVFPTRFVVRGEEERALIPVVRDLVRSLDPTLPVYGVAPMRALLDAQLSEQRFLAVLLMSFAALALVLAAAGVYGVLAYRVARRRHEIGVRLTFGARRDQIVRLVLRQGLGLVGLGIALGGLGALAGTRILRGLLFEISETNLLALIGAAGVLAAVATVACLVPAARAASVDPAAALRD